MEEKKYSEVNRKSNGFYTLLANRFFNHLKGNLYGQLQIVIMIIQISITAILIIQCLKHQ